LRYGDPTGAQDEAANTTRCIHSRKVCLI
jgi:hypothetical protein